MLNMMVPYNVVANLTSLALHHPGYTLPWPTGVTIPSGVLF